jgi:uncharacterized protein YukE
MDSLSVSPDALRDRGWDVADACHGSRFASAGHESDLAVHQHGWVGSSAAALASLREHWQTSSRHLHGRVDALADRMRDSSTGFADMENHHAQALRALTGH